MSFYLYIYAQWFYDFFIEVWLIYNVVLVSSIQQSNSAMCVCVYSFRFLSCQDYYKILSTVSCATTILWLNKKTGGKNQLQGFFKDMLAANRVKPQTSVHVLQAGPLSALLCSPQSTASDTTVKATVILYLLSTASPCPGTAQTWPHPMLWPQEGGILSLILLGSPVDCSAEECNHRMALLSIPSSSHPGHPQICPATLKYLENTAHWL